MTLEEKHKAIIAETLACLRQIVECRDLSDAKWLAHMAIISVKIIAEEGRVPSTEESLEYLRRMGMSRTN